MKNASHSSSGKLVFLVCLFLVFWSFWWYFHILLYSWGMFSLRNHSTFHLKCPFDVLKEVEPNGAMTGAQCIFFFFLFIENHLLCTRCSITVHNLFKFYTKCWCYTKKFSKSSWKPHCNIWNPTTFFRLLTILYCRLAVINRSQCYLIYGFLKPV